MIAFDTNLLVRLLVDDHPKQSDLAVGLLKGRTVWISRTVLLETEWVLRSVYRIPRERIEQFFMLLLSTENTVIEDHAVVKQALEWHHLGSDFADALHLAACGRAVMHTLDRGFCKAAREAGSAPEIRVLEG